jgi:hypothetical protein
MISTCITKKKRQLMQVEWKWCDKFNRDNLKHKLYMTCNLLEEAIPLLILYSMTLHKDYIQMLLFLETPKWESQNWDFCCPKTLDAYIFLKIKFILRVRGQYLIALEKIFSMMYSTLQSNLIWPLVSRDLWSIIKSPI